MALLVKKMLGFFFVKIRFRLFKTKNMAKGEGGKALVAGPLKNYHFFAASLKWLGAFNDLGGNNTFL